MLLKWDSAATQYWDNLKGLHLCLGVYTVLAAGHITAGDRTLCIRLPFGKLFYDYVAVSENSSSLLYFYLTAGRFAVILISSGNEFHSHGPAAKTAPSLTFRDSLLQLTIPPFTRAQLLRAVKTAERGAEFVPWQVLKIRSSLDPSLCLRRETVHNSSSWDNVQPETHGVRGDQLLHTNQMKS